ncbi:MAG TPA: hypothetical protein VHD88_08570 [Pyrinomonadaceae bacterium]|nr:hypothetical protein [Pyrinomonadaceae bacterium]
MHLLGKILFLSAILAGALALTACPSQTTISKINANPAKYRNKEIALIGTVTDSYGLLGNGIYELDDGTGRVWVMTTQGVPTKGTRVGTSGEVHTGVNYGGKNYGLVLQEEHRRSKSK